jgi:dTDP-4-amino-4,6-dideoxygalactose transaminase
MYDDAFRGWSHLDVPVIPPECEHNAHMYYIKVKDLEERTNLIAYLLERDIKAVFHYVPLHSAQAGRKYGRFHGEDVHTTRESERLLRLPLYYHLPEEETGRIIECVKKFFA